MKHLKLFDTVQSYNTYKSSGQLALPNVSLCEDQQSIFYIPQPYDAEIEYLQCTGTEYIDTLFIPNQDTKVDVDFMFNTKQYAQAEFVFGVQSPSFAFLNYYACRSDYNTDLKNCGSINTKQKYNVLKDKNYTYINGSLVAQSNYMSFTCTNSMAIFSDNSTYFSYDLLVYQCKIYDNNTLIRNFTPVRVGQTGYMYDKVSGQLFGNSGIGNFILGPDK